jgi:diacylglycerol kinase
MNAFRGVRAVWKEERNFKIIVIIAVAVIVILFFGAFSPGEIVSCILAVSLVVCAEMMNTAIEDLCDKIQPDQDPAIGKIKDMSSGSVLVASLGALLVGVVVVLYHYFGVIL